MVQHYKAINHDKLLLSQAFLAELGLNQSLTVLPWSTGRTDQDWMHGDVLDWDWTSKVYLGEISLFWFIYVYHCLYTHPCLRIQFGVLSKPDITHDPFWIKDISVSNLRPIVGHNGVLITHGIVNVGCPEMAWNNNVDLFGNLRGKLCENMLFQTVWTLRCHHILVIDYFAGKKITISMATCSIAPLQ